MLGLLGWALGINPLVLIEGAQMVAGGDQPRTAPVQPGRQGAPTDQMGNFVSRVLGETEDVWSQVLPAQANSAYTPPTLVLFSGVTQSGMRHGPIGDGAVLLPARSEGVSRHLVLPGHAAAAWAVAATSPMPT